MPNKFKNYEKLTISYECSETKPDHSCDTCFYQHLEFHFFSNDDDLFKLHFLSWHLEGFQAILKLYEFCRTVR